MFHIRHKHISWSDTVHPGIPCRVVDSTRARQSLPRAIFVFCHCIDAQDLDKRMQPIRGQMRSKVGHFTAHVIFTWFTRARNHAVSSTSTGCLSNPQKHHLRCLYPVFSPISHPCYPGLREFWSYQGLGIMIDFASKSRLLVNSATYKFRSSVLLEAAVEGAIRAWLVFLALHR